MAYEKKQTGKKRQKGQLYKKVFFLLAAVSRPLQCVSNPPVAFRAKQLSLVSFPTLYFFRNRVLHAPLKSAHSTSVHNTLRQSVVNSWQAQSRPSQELSVLATKPVVQLLVVLVGLSSREVPVS